MHAAFFPSRSPIAVSKASFEICPSGFSGSPSVMASVSFWEITNWELLTDATVTSPAPALSAPWAERHAAPIFPLEPPKMTTCPKVPLWPSAGLGLKVAKNSASSKYSKAPLASSRTKRGIPMSMTKRRPV